jgi:ATP synthase F0 subunit b
MRSTLVFRPPQSPLSVVTTIRPALFTTSRRTRNGLRYSGLACARCAAMLRILSAYGRAVRMRSCALRIFDAETISIALVILRVFWTLLIFVGLLVVLGKYAWRPMLDALSRREQFIRQTLETAAKDRAEAERMMAEHRQALAKSKQEAQAILDQGRQDAETVRQRLHQQAQAEADGIIERARQEIHLAKQSALQDLQNVAADLSVNVASKIIQRSLSSSDQQRLVEESLKQLVESGNGKSGT